MIFEKEAVLLELKDENGQLKDKLSLSEIKQEQYQVQIEELTGKLQ